MGKLSSCLTNTVAQAHLNSKHECVLAYTLKRQIFKLQRQTNKKPKIKTILGQPGLQD